MLYNFLPILKKSFVHIAYFSNISTFPSDPKTPIQLGPLVVDFFFTEKISCAIWFSVIVKLICIFATEDFIGSCYLYFPYGRQLWRNFKWMITVYVYLPGLKTKWGLYIPENEQYNYHKITVAWQKLKGIIRSDKQLLWLNVKVKSSFHIALLFRWYQKVFLTVGKMFLTVPDSICNHHQA